MTTPLSLAEDVEFRVERVEPGTTYPDDPAEEIPPGWHVIGCTHGADQEDGAEVQFRIDWAIDAEGNVVRKQLAELIARHLNETFGEAIR